MKKRRGNKSSKLPLILLSIAVLVIITFSVLLSSDLGGSPITQVVETSQLITPLDYQQDFGESTTHLLIDVRTPEEFASGHIQNAINISVETLPDRLNEVPDNLPIVVYCRSGNRSATAAEILVSAGYQPVYDLGGIQTWTAQGYPVEY
jgi:rhodanese-related sulfurtransferase